MNRNMDDNQPDNSTDGNPEDDQPHKDHKHMAGSEQEDESDSDFESDQEWKGLTSQELGKRLAAQFCAIDNDSMDTNASSFQNFTVN